MPKIWPGVAAFLDRINIAERFNLQLHAPGWRDIPLREWELMRAASISKNESESEQLRDFKRQQRTGRQHFEA